MKYKPKNEQMWHEISHLFIKPCAQCVFNAWYLCVKCTNYEWTNFAQFSLLNYEMLSLWCRSKSNIYSTNSSFHKCNYEILTKFIDFSSLIWSWNSFFNFVVKSNSTSHLDAMLKGFKHPIYGLNG
jgi:hypothetical protein